MRTRGASSEREVERCKPGCMRAERDSAAGRIRTGSETGGATVGERRGWIGKLLWVGVGIDAADRRDFHGRRRHWLDESGGTRVQMLRYCARFGRGFVIQTETLHRPL